MLLLRIADILKHLFNLEIFGSKRKLL